MRISKYIDAKHTIQYLKAIKCESVGIIGGGAGLKIKHDRPFIPIYYRLDCYNTGRRLSVTTNLLQIIDEEYKFLEEYAQEHGVLYERFGTTPTVGTSTTITNLPNYIHKNDFCTKELTVKFLASEIDVVQQNAYALCLVLDIDESKI